MNVKIGSNLKIMISFTITSTVLHGCDHLQMDQSKRQMSHVLRLFW